MKQEQFEQIIGTQLEMVRNVLITKQKEYATEDRLHNFRVVASLRGCTMEQALGGMLSKHTVSIYDMIESGKEYPSAQWNEKINDHIVYLLLLKAITEERINKKEPSDSDQSKHARRDNQAAMLIGQLKYDSAKDTPILHNHDPKSPHLTSDEVLLALEIKEILNKRGWYNSNIRYGGYTNSETGDVDLTDNESTLPSMFKNER